VASGSQTDDGVGTSAAFSYLSRIALDVEGNAFVTDTSYNTGCSVIRKVTPASVVTTLTTCGNVQQQPVCYNGPSNITMCYPASIGSSAVFSSFGNVSVTSTTGHSYAIDVSQGVIFALGSMVPLAGTARSGAQPAWQNGLGTLASFAWNGGPYCASVDSYGNLYVDDDGGEEWTGRKSIRKVTSSGDVSTIMDGLNTAAFFQSDPTGSLIVADFAQSYTVFRLTPTC
jgi:hypothetical protein